MAGGGIPAGRLSIEIVAEIARLQSDLDKAKKLVNAASGDIGKSAKAANDNLAAMGGGAKALSADFARLKASLDPAWAAQEKFNSAQRLGMDAFRQGAINREQFIAHMRAINAELKGATGPMADVTTRAGAQRAGLQQLSFQLDDVATQYAMGTKASVIFAQQAGQVLQAVQMLGLGTGRLAAFLSGPWGIAITVATVALSPFIGKLFESGDAARKAADDYRTAADEARGLIGATNALALNAQRMEKNRLDERRMQLELFIGRQAKDARGQPMFSYAEQKELAAVNMELAKRNSLIGIAERENAKLDATLKKTTQSIDRATGSARSHATAIGGVGRAYAAAHDSLEDFIQGLQQMAAAMDSLFGDIARDVLKDVDDGLEKVADEWNDLVKAFNDAPRPFELAADETARWNDELRATVNLLDNIGAGGLGTILSLFGGVRSGDFSGVGGRTGAIAQLLWNTLSPISAGSGIGRDGEHLARTLGDVFKDALDSVFGSSGTFTRLMSGAALGGAVGGGGLGSLLGGAAGQLAGDALRKTKFGSSVIGGAVASLLPIIGGLIGGLFKKTTKGQAIITNTGVSTSGNNADLINAMGQNGSQIQSALAQMAQAFGGEVGKYAVSIAQRSSGWIHVDSSGAANVGDQNWISKNAATAIYNGKDMTAALKAAIRNAIEDGAIAGMTATEKAIALKADDIEAGLARALTFHNALEELRQATDPAGLALEQLAKRMAELRDIAAEGGATLEEMNKLQQLEDLKRKEILDAQAADELEKLNELRQIEVQIMDAQGRTSEALALAREIEKSSAEEALRAKLDELYAAQDLQAAQAAEATRLNERRGIEIEILKLQGRAQEALTLQRQAELETLDPLNRELKSIQFAWQDAADRLEKANGKVAAAKDALNAAYRREIATFEEVSGKWRSIGDGLRDALRTLVNDPVAGNYLTSLIGYRRIAGGARAGNERDAGLLGEAARGFLSVSLSQASTRVQYLRDLAMVRRDLNAAIGTADSKASAAERTAADMNAALGKLIEIDETALTVAQALAQLKDAQAEADAAQAARDALTDPVPQIEMLNATSTQQAETLADIRLELNRTRGDLGGLREELAAANAQSTDYLGKVQRLLASWDGQNAVNVRTEGADTVTTVAA